MKAITATMLMHLASGCTTYVMCWKITPHIGAVIGFTEHQDDIFFEGVTFSARSGFSPSALRNTADLAVNNFDVTFLLEFDGTEEAQLIGGYYDYAKIEVFFVNYADLSMGKVMLERGTLGDIDIGRGQAKAEIRGLTQELQQEVLELTSPTCRADLGDSRCTINLAAFTVTGTITAVSNNKIFADSSRTQPEGYFDGGLLTWTSGNNAQLTMEVKHYSAGAKQFELYYAMPKAVQIGDTYQVYRGCNKRRETCRDVFGNIYNFQGEPDLPGIDQVMQFG